MTRKKFFVALVLFVLVIALTAPATAAPKNSEEITFTGDLTVEANGQETQIKGSGKISMPQPFGAKTQDDHVTAIPTVFQQDGRLTEKAALTVTTSKPFTIGGAKVLTVYKLEKSEEQGEEAVLKLVPVDPGKLTEDERNFVSDSAKKKKASYKIPAGTQDYFIYIGDGTPDDQDEEERDAVVLLFLKMSVK